MENTENKMAGQVTPEEIKAWKEKYDDIFAVKCDGHVAYLRKPSRQALLTSSSCHPKILIKEFYCFLIPCQKHCLSINLLVQRWLDLYCFNGLCQCKHLVHAHP